jgi:hypothetical protein
MATVLLLPARLATVRTSSFGSAGSRIPQGSGSRTKARRGTLVDHKAAARCYGSGAMELIGAHVPRD